MTKSINQLAVSSLSVLALSFSGCATGPSTEYQDAVGGAAGAAAGGTTSAPVPATCINSKGQTVGVGIGDECSCGPDSTGTTLCGADGHWGACSNCTNTVVANCTPGSLTPANSCTCASGATGRKTCVADGTKYGDCVCGDQDGDGYNPTQSGGTDCDDTNAAVHPGATEICGNGKDDDCVGGDATCPATGTGGATSVGGVDKDKDGHNSTATGGDDCDDNDATVHPGATEICGNKKDDDCVGGDATCPATGTGGATGVVQTTCVSPTHGNVSVGYIDNCVCPSGTTGQTQCQANGTWNTCYNCAAVAGTGGAPNNGTGGAANNGTGGTTATGTKNVVIKFLSPKPFTDLGYIQFSGGWGNNIVTSATAWTLFCDSNNALSGSASSGQLSRSGDTLTCVIQVPSSIKYLGLGVRSHKDNVDGTFFPSHQQDQYSPWQASGGDAQTFCGSTVCDLEYGTVWVDGVQMTLANNVAQIYTWTNDANFSHVGSKVTCTGTGLACGDYSKLGNLWVAYIGG